MGYMILKSMVCRLHYINAIKLEALILFFFLIIHGLYQLLTMMQRQMFLWYTTLKFNLTMV